MQMYWSSLLRYCPWDSVFVGCRFTSTSGIPLPALLSNMFHIVYLIEESLIR